MKQKLIALILVLCSVGALLVPQVMAEEKPVSRIEWVRQLVKAFDMTVEEDNYPDNYYSDMEETSAGYRDLLVAVEFGVIDLEAGSAFEPDQPATREFAAHTLNFCLGFQLDQGAEYTYAESAEVSYPDDLQVAVNRGWFALQDGKVLPQQTLTSAEATAMLKDAAAVIAGDKVDVGHNNSFTYESGVVEIPESTPVEINEDGTITVVNLPAAVKVGTTFVIYRGGFPKGYKAVSIREDGQTSVLTVEKVALDSILSSADAEGRVQGDLADFEPADGVDIAYIFSDGSETTDRTQAARATKHIKDIVLNKTISGVAVSATLSELSLDYGLSGGPTTPVSARVILNGDASISSTIPFSAPASIELGYVPVGFFGSITITADIGVDGTITLSYGCSFSMGVSYSSMDGFRAIANFSKESFSLAANFNVHAGLKVAANITNLEFIHGTIYARIGAQCNYMVVPHSEPEYPDLCVGTDSWLYANVGLNVGVSCWKINKSYSKQIDIWSRRNSPIRTVSHLEDNVWVPSCTCDTTGVFGRYFTPINSRYYNDGRRDVVNMPTYTYTVDGDGNATITGYSGGVAALFIPETIDGHTVTAIGYRAFKGNLRLAAVTIPDTITEIGQDAFSGCTGLTSIKLPKNLKTLGGDAFRDCTGLTSVLIPKTVESIHTYSNGFFCPFRGCDNLQEVKFEDGMTRIPNLILGFCGAKLNIVIPDSVTEIGEAAFLNSGIVAVTIPDTVTEIEEDAFSGCTGLTSIKLPKNLKILGDESFRDCTGLTSVLIPKTVENTHSYYGGIYGPFRGCDNLQEVKFEDGMTRIPNLILGFCGAKLNIVIPDSVTEIGEAAFLNSGIVAVTIPDTVTEIEEDAFSGCTGLTDVKLPKNLKTLERDAFRGCTGLTSVLIPKTVENTHYYYDGIYSPFRGCNNLQEVKFEDGMTRIPNSILCFCAAKLNIVIPDSVTEIGEAAFLNSGIVAVTIPDAVTEIEEDAFRGCTGLTDIKLPDSVVNIGTKIFANCTSLTDVTLPNAWELIPASTFEGCTALEKLVLPESVQYIRDGAFKNCTALKEIVWSKAPELIDSNAFYNCDAITEMDIPATVTSVGYQAFYDCDGLTKITIPDGVTSLGDSVFYDCDALTDVKLGAGITTIPASAFRHCDALEQLTVPRRVTAIKDNAFKDSVKFSSITIPRSVTSVSANAFSYLDKLTIYGVAGTYAETFANTNSIKFVDRQVSATSASLDQTVLTLNKGASGQLTLTVTPEDFTDEVVWKSSDTAVVTVSDTGLVKAVGVGTATIKVSVGKASASCKVTVLQPVTSISLNRSSLTMEATDTFQLQASVYPSNAADQRVQWTSSDPAVASVDENGLVTALKKGTATVTAAALDGGGVTRTCQVTVSNTAYICTQPEQMESPHDYPGSCTDVWLYTSPGAQKLYVTFDERTCMEDGFDYLYIYDGNGQQVGKYTGTELAGTIVTVPGDTVKIQINSDGSGSEWGFKVTGIRAEASAVVVNPIGGDNAPACQVDGQTLTVTCDRACVAAYKDADGNYVRLIPTANANGSYSYTLPEGVAEVTVAVRGDLDGDGKLTAKEARRVMTAVTRADSLDALQMLCADLNGDGKISAMEARQVLSAVTNSASVKW